MGWVTYKDVKMLSFNSVINIIEIGVLENMIVRILDYNKVTNRDIFEAIKNDYNIDNPEEELILNLDGVSIINEKFLINLLRERCKNSYSEDHFKSNIKMINANNRIKTKFSKAIKNLLRERNTLDTILKGRK